MTDRSLRRARVHAPGGAADDAPAYDFAAPELLTDVQRDRIDGAFEVWARAVAVQLTAKTRIVTTVSAEPFVLTTLAAFGARFGRGDGFTLAAVEGSTARLVYATPMSQSIRWASRLLGGAGRPLGVPRGPTAIERALIVQLADDHVHELAVALGDLLPPVAVEGVMRSLGSAAGEPDELMLCARFAVDAAGGSVPLDVALPAAPVLAALGHGLVPRDAGEIRRGLEGHVAAAPVEVALRFAETRVGPSIVLGLGEGSLIPLEHEVHRPLAITVNGAPILRATPGGHGDRLACVVVGPEGA